jgi:predicted transposase YbfD/YdcC
MDLWEAFSELPDPRTGPAQRHDLREMIVMALGAVLCGCNTWVEVANWAEDHKAWLGEYLELKHGTPSHDTFGRVFSLLDGAVFERCFRQWISGVVGAAAGVVAIDGKTLCGSRDEGEAALHMVSAFATDSGVCLGQEGTCGKGHEIAGMRTLLGALTLKGCIVTIDALGCQKEIAAQIVEAGGDYVLAVKDNQGGLSEAVQEFFDEGGRSGFGDTALDCVETVEKDHGRLETRRYTWVSRLDWMERPMRSQWRKLAGVGMVERRREIAGRVSVERSFYIGSCGVDSAQTLARAARGHWGVENQLHWVLDVVFREDDCRVRRGHGARNFSALRKFALSLLRQDTQYPKRSLNSRRQTADRNAHYRASLLGLQPRG